MGADDLRRSAMGRDRLDGGRSGFGRFAMACAAGLALLATLSGCATRQASATRAASEAEIYRQYSNLMTRTGRFRTDYSPADAPFTTADLERNFLKVVFEPEAQLAQYQRGASAERRLAKWTGPLTYAVVGDGVRPSDRAALRGIAATLSRHSGLSIREARPGGPTPQMSIFILTETARAFIQNAEQDTAWYQSSILRDWLETLNPPCFALFNAGQDRVGEIRDAAIFIKAEMEDPLRTACFVEEFTQTMGLVFDHEDVRPSIFNDDQEFIALTEHDETLLSVLYDPLLKPGMTRAEAAPIVRRILRRRRRSL